MGLFFNPPDYNKCSKKRMCCNGGTNHGSVYDVDKPCIDGYQWNLEECRCSEICMCQWVYKYTVTVQLVGVDAYNPGSFPFCPPTALKGSGGPINNNQSGPTRVIYGRGPVVEIARDDRSFGSCVATRGCPGCERSDQPTSGNITSIMLASVPTCGNDLCGGGTQAWNQGVPFLPYQLNTGNPHGAWQWTIDKIEVQDPNTGQFVDLPREYPLPEDYQWPGS